jgi:diguanylate cyclase (GGDEF)-like protein/PAS domain S-box-containing protein
MNPTGELAPQNIERLQRLKQRAKAVLAHSDQSQPDDQVDMLQVTQLLEDLRIYQVELELQNEELRSAQQEAETARRRYQSLFDEIPLPAVVIDANGMVDEANERAIRLLGERKRFVTMDARLWNKLKGKERARMHQALRDVGLGESMVLQAMVLGEPESSAQPAALFDMHLIGLSMDYRLDRRVLVLMLDRSVEMAREHDQRFYTSLLDASASIIYAVDQHGKFLLANHALLQLLGRTAPEVLQHKRENLMPLRDAILHTEVDQKVLLTGQSVTVEEQIHLAPPRATLDFLSRKFPLRDLSGIIYGVGGISTDISAIKDQQRQTLLSETVFMNSSESIIITDAQTCIVRVNPAFVRQTGFSVQTVLGHPTSMLKSGRQDKAFYQAMWESLEKQGRWTGEFNNRRADGSYYTVCTNINKVCDANGKVLHYIAVQTDITQLQEAQLALAHQASFDSLTGLPNRTLFNDRLSQLMAFSQRHHKTFALLFVDVDRFKEVNDTLGHQVGDDLLKQIAQRLQQGVRTEDSVARIGGDEFVVLLPDTEEAGAQTVATNLLVRLREPVLLESSHSYRPMGSMGLAMYPQDGDSPDQLLRCADLAMYQAKQDGRNRVTSYTSAMSQTSDHAFAMQIELTQAIEQQQLCVYFQPKCRLDTGELMGAEVLVRWQRPGHGLVFPGEFIGLAEKYGLLVELDQWVMQEAVRQLGVWKAAGLWRTSWRLAVNQSVADLQRADLLTYLPQLLQAHQVGVGAIELEMTEDALLQQTTEQLARLTELRRMGFSLAIDDFGTGYSSLAYLRQLPVSVIKIDQSFIKSMVSNDNDTVLVRTIVDMARDLGLALVAEGVENEDQRVQLAKLGVELGQGYLFGRAVNSDEFAVRWLNPPDTIRT